MREGEEKVGILCQWGRKTKKVGSKEARRGSYSPPLCVQYASFTTSDEATKRRGVERSVAAASDRFDSRSVSLRNLSRGSSPGRRGQRRRPTSVRRDLAAGTTVSEDAPRGGAQRTRNGRSEETRVGDRKVRVFLGRPASVRVSFDIASNRETAAVTTAPTAAAALAEGIKSKHAGSRAFLRVRVITSHASCRGV